MVRGGLRRERQAALESSASVSAWDRELIELILHQPEALEPILEHIGEEHVASPVARQLFALALGLHHAGEAPTFARLMNLIDDEQAKNLLVDCDERGLCKAASDAQLRQQDLIERLQQRQQDIGHSQTIAQLNSNDVDEQEKLEALQSLYKDWQRKRHQAGSSPTDG